jgi:hypothetical protein
MTQPSRSAWRMVLGYTEGQGIPKCPNCHCRAWAFFDTGDPKKLLARCWNGHLGVVRRDDPDLLALITTRTRPTVASPPPTQEEAP